MNFVVENEFPGRTTKTEIENSSTNLEQEDLLIDETITLSVNGTTKTVKTQLKPSYPKTQVQLLVRKHKCSLG